MILQNSGWDVSSLEVEDKVKRNIQIGYLQKNNPRLSKYLHEETNRIINYYLTSNGIDRSELITLQKDGFISQKKITHNKTSIPIDFKYGILRIIINLDRSAFLIIKDNNEVEVKGVRDKPIGIDFYNLFRFIDFNSAKAVVRSIENMRKVVFSSENIEWFSKMDENGAYVIPIKDQGIIKLNSSVLDVIDIEDIDRSILWEEYIWPFCRPIILTYI